MGSGRATVVGHCVKLTWLFLVAIEEELKIGIGNEWVFLGA